MASEAEELVNGPGLLLTVAGAVMTVFYGAYALWSGISMIMTLANAGMSGAQLADGADGAVIGLGLALWQLVFQMFGVLLYVVLAVVSIFIATGGMALKSLTSVQKGKRAAVLAILVPLAGMLAGGLLSIASLSCCGLVFGLVPQVLVLLLGAAAGGLALNIAGNETVIAASGS